MVATESQDVLNRRFVSGFASVLGFFNTLLEASQVEKAGPVDLRRSTSWNRLPGTVFSSAGRLD